MLNNLWVVIKTVKASGKSKAGNIGKSHQWQYIPKILEDLNVKWTPMNNAVLKLDLSDGQWYYATDSALTCTDVQNCIEAFTDLDLSAVVVTLWEICGDITFCAGWSTIDRTNTIQTGTTSFDENYVATYNDNSTINFNGDVYRGATSTQTYISWSIITGETNYNSFTATYDDASTLNFEGSTINIYDGATFNITDSFFNSTNNTRVFDGDTITYSSTTEVTYNGTTINYNATIQNYDGDTINRNNVTQNVTNSTITYDDNSTVTFEWDVYIGGNIINITNNFNTGWLATEEWGFWLWNDINNVLTCDWNNATQDVTDPTNMDYVQLVVGWVRAWAPLTNASTTWAPGYYGSASEMRSLPLTPAIINSSDFGASFRYGDSTYVLVTDFGFSIPLTDTITWVKVSVIYDYSAPTISVDCITITVYSTDGSPLQSGVNIYEAWVLVVANATDLNFNTGATVTDMWGGVARVDITGWSGWAGLYNVASDNDSFIWDWSEDTRVLPSTPIDSNLLHLTTDSWTNLIVWIDYLLVGDTITFINIIPLWEVVYARWILGNPIVTPVTLNTATHNAVSWEYIVVTYSAGNSTINLPDASVNNWSVIKVKKFTGEDVLVTTIVPFGAQLIDGFTGATMNINRTMYTFTAINGNWYLWD